MLKYIEDGILWLSKMFESDQLCVKFLWNWYEETMDKKVLEMSKENWGAEYTILIKIIKDVSYLYF